MEHTITIRLTDGKTQSLPPEIDDIIAIAEQVASGWGEHFIVDEFAVVFGAAVDAYWRKKASS
jgi:hypothetical protein